MSTTYTFTLRQQDMDLVEALANLPKRQRSQWIRDALRFYLARQNCETPNQYRKILTELTDIKMKINQISSSPPPQPQEDIWDDDEGELLDLDI